MFHRTLTVLITSFVLGCGRPATEADCETIFRRSAEIELASQNVVAKEQVEKRIRDLKSSRQELIRECIGQRISDKALQCVEGATTSAQLDACLK